jgi:hypothetical protein
VCTMRQLALPLPFLAEERAGPTNGGAISPALPPWESFPAEDRRTLVLLLVEAGRRRVQPRPASRPPTRG